MNTATETLERFNHRSLVELANSDADYVLSLTMPTHERGDQTRQDPIRFKNLLARAAEKIRDVSVPTNLIDNLSAKQSDQQFWRRQRSGLAIFCDRQSTRSFSTRRALPEMVCLDRYPHLKNLVPDLNRTSAAVVLTLNWGVADLRIFDQEQLQTTSEAEFPLAIEDLVLPRDPETQLQFSSHQIGGKGRSKIAMYHGHGEGEDKIEADRHRFLSRVGERVAAAVYLESLPLIVVGTSELIGHFEAATDEIVDVRIAVNPAGMDTKVLDQQIRDALDDWGTESVRDAEQEISSAISGDRIIRYGIETIWRTRSGRFGWKRRGAI